MRLGLMSKLAIAIAAAILPVIALSAVLRVRREAELFEAKARDDDVLLGRAVAAAATSVWRTSGPREAKQLVAAANTREHDVRIRWIRTDATEPTDNEAPSTPLIAPLRVDAPLTLRARRPNDSADSLFTYVAAPMPGAPTGAIELRESLSYEDAFLSSTIRHAALATAAVVASCTLLALGLGAVLVGRPIASLVQQARRIGDGDLSRRIGPTRRDELGVLSGELDDMCDRLEAARVARNTALEQLRHAERLGAVGKLAAGIAHELGTPLNVISGHAQLVVDDYPPESPAHANAAIVIDQTDRVATIIRHLLDFARRRSPERKVRDLVATVRHALQVLQPLAEQRGATIAVEAPSSPIEAEIDAGQIEQVITNLAINGMQAMAPNGRLTVSIARASNGVRIEVADTGIGIPRDVLPKIFEPFFTTKGVGEGSGLGLSVTYGIVHEHGGSIEVDSIVGVGSRFAISLPERTT
jgi:two-component system, NtrC family, sensor kinase